MSYYTKEELNKIGFKSLGENILLSRKSSIYGAENMCIGNNVRIDDFCMLTGKIDIRNHVHIAPGSILYGGNSGITMDDYSGLAFNCTLVATSDDYSGNSLTNPTVPKKYTGVTDAPIYLEKHVILGTGSIVLPDVTIAEGVASGANTLFIKNVEPWGIYIGSPAKRVKDRSRNALKLQKEFEDSKG